MQCIRVTAVNLDKVLNLIYVWTQLALSRCSTLCFVPFQKDIKKALHIETVVNCQA